MQTVVKQVDEAIGALRESIRFSADRGQVAVISVRAESWLGTFEAIATRLAALERVAEAARAWHPSHSFNLDCNVCAALAALDRTVRDA